MSVRWSILTTRMGADVREPADVDLQQALNDVFTAEDSEHPNASLCLGADGGPMFVLDVYGSGKLLFDQWADSDFIGLLAPQGMLTGVSPDVAMRLWQSLRRGDVEALRGEAWIAALG